MHIYLINIIYCIIYYCAVQCMFSRSRVAHLSCTLAGLSATTPTLQTNNFRTCFKHFLHPQRLKSSCFGCLRNYLSDKELSGLPRCSQNRELGCSFFDTREFIKNHQSTGNLQGFSLLFSTRIYLGYGTCVE